MAPTLCSESASNRRICKRVGSETCFSRFEALRTPTTVKEAFEADAFDDPFVRRLTTAARFGAALLAVLLTTLLIFTDLSDLLADFRASAKDSRESLRDAVRDLTVRLDLAGGMVGILKPKENPLGDRLEYPTLRY